MKVWYFNNSTHSVMQLFLSTTQTFKLGVTDLPRMCRPKEFRLSMRTKDQAKVASHASISFWEEKGINVSFLGIRDDVLI